MLSEPTDFCRLILVRHPELDPAVANLVVGQGEAALGRRGQAQVLELMEQLDGLQVATVFSATQPQCADVGRALASKLSVSLEDDARLNDQDMGSWQGRAWEDLAQSQGELVRDFFANFGEAKAPGGESLGEAVERMFGWWQEAAPKGLGKCFVVLSSGSMLSGFAAAMLGMRLSRAVSLNLPHAGIGVLDCFGNGARITCWNPGALAGI